MLAALCCLPPKFAPTVMEIQNAVDLLLYSLMTLGCVFIGIPSGVYLCVAAVRHLLHHGARKYAGSNSLKINGFGSSPVETLLLGILALALSIWFLFLDRGGHLLNYVNEVGRYFSWS